MFIEFNSRLTICLISGLEWFVKRMKTWLYRRITFVFSSSLLRNESFSFCRSLSFFSTSCARRFAFSRDLRTAMLLRSRLRRYSSVPLSRFFKECFRLWTRFLLSFWKLLKWAVGERKQFKRISQISKFKFHSVELWELYWKSIFKICDFPFEGIAKKFVKESDLVDDELRLV